MNKSFRLVWSAARGAWVVTHELVRARGKGNGRSARKSVLALAVLSLALGHAAWGAGLGAPPSPISPTALPQGGTVAAGSASIAQPTSNLLTITQATQQAVINWNSFDIGAQARVNFVQPSTQASVLNRVLGNTPTQIAGQLSAKPRGQRRDCRQQGIRHNHCGKPDWWQRERSGQRCREPERG